MKNQVFPLLVLMLLITGSCKKDDYAPYNYANEATIYSESSKARFSNIAFIIKPYLLDNNEKKYISTDTLRNFIIKVNNATWPSVNSYGTDTSLYKKEIVNSFFVSDELIKYPVVAPFKVKIDTLTKAGQYADLLNNYLSLLPGDYICTIESFELTNSEGLIKKVSPNINVPLHVRDNHVSTFVGEFDVLVK